MSDEKAKVTEEVKPAAEEVGEPDTPETVQPLSVKQIFDAYPNDREKARDYLLMGIQNELNRVANALEYFAKKDIAAVEAAKIRKPISEP